MGSGHRGGFVVDKGEATECDFGLGLMMMGNHQHHHHSHSNDERFSGDHHGTSSSPGGGGGATGVGSGGFGAMFLSSSNNNNNNHQESSTAITSSSTTSVYGHVGGGDGSSVAPSVQRSSHAFDPSSFKSWGGPLMGLGGGEMTRVFTASQRQELERQTIIFKYMAASMPIPQELLISLSSKYPSQLSLPPYLSNDYGSGGVKSAMDLRYTIGSRDGEPWRCRRTDGKKWRCSRDVAPDQKYCERHSHKGRPSRSRKHVESSSTSSSSTSTSISTARNNNNTLMPPSSSTPSAVNPANITIKPSFLYQPSPSMFLSQHHQNASQSRFPEWFMKREADHHHDQSTSGGVPTSASPFFPQTELDQMTPTQSPTLPRQFLDAWSMGPKPDDIVEITGKPAHPGSSLLTLSMAGGGIEDSEEAAARLGMGLDVGGNGERYSWMGSSAPGGPLAEALCLGIVRADAGGGRGSHGNGESGGQGLGFNK